MNSDLSAAVRRLRMRACWTDIPTLLRDEQRDFETLFTIASAAVERSAFTSEGWAEADDTVRLATEAATTDEERALVVCDDTYLCYIKTVFTDENRADAAHDKLREAEELAAPGSPVAALLAFRRGLITENLDGDHAAARQSYARAHEAWKAAEDTLALSFTYRHFAILDWKAGQHDEARSGFTASLELREEVGFLIGLAPALSGLARVTDEPEASRLRAESHRLIRAMDLASRLGK